MSLYEVTFVMRQDIPAHDVHKKADSFVEIVEGKGGELVKKEYWGLRSLSYTVNKNKKGYYVMLGVKFDQSGVHELERNFKISEDVIRYTIFKVNAISQEPSSIMSASVGNE